MLAIPALGMLRWERYGYTGSSRMLEKSLRPHPFGEATGDWWLLRKEESLSFR